VEYALSSGSDLPGVTDRSVDAVWSFDVPMSRGLFARLAIERGLKVECAIDSWGADGRYDLSAYADAITICRRD